MKKLLVLMIAAMALTVSAKKPKGTTVNMLTSKGRIVLCLYDDTPLHRDNFIKLAKEGYFDGLLFHRVIKDFMIQGGDPDSRDAAPDAALGNGGPGYEIPAEILFPAEQVQKDAKGPTSRLRHFHKRGALAAARTGDEVNPERKSSGSQFYIAWGKTFTDKQLDQLDSYLKRTSNGEVFLTPEMRKYYKRYGGTPHLDGAYTVFGEVVKGLEVVNAIQQVSTGANDRPIEDVKILSVEVKK